MNEEKSTTQDGCKNWCGPKSGGGATGCVYGLALVGAAIYYIQQAETFWQGALGILKALVWPAIVVYKLLVFLSA